MARHKVLRSPRLVRRKRKARATKAAFALLLGSAVLAAAAYALTLPRLLISSIEIRGDAPVSKRALEATVSDALAGAYAGVFPKANILLYPKRRMTETLLARYPALASADAGLRNFSMLEVFVAPREPVAVFCAGVGDAAPCALLDATGVAFRAAPRDAAEPRIEDAEALPGTGLGARVIAEDRLARLLSLLSRLRERGLRVESLRIAGGQALAVQLDGGGAILFRERGDFGPELARLDALLAEQNLIAGTRERLRIDYIDLRHGNKIYFKPR